MTDSLNNELKFGIQTNGIKHDHLHNMPDINTRFEMVYDAKVFDYVDKTPEIHEIRQFKKSSKKFNLPILAGGWFYEIGNHKKLLENNLKIAKELGSLVHNTQIQAYKEDGKLASDLEIRDTYLEAYDLGLKYEVIPCFEIHVNMWSEDFLRVSKVGKMVEEKGAELEQPLAIARDIKQLYEKVLKAKQTETIANFLLNNDEIRHVVRRAFIVEKFPYSEIQDNTIAASLVPIDMLRLKLSFFGAVKFDPRSDKWLRINMYQGAPLPHEMKLSNDTWVYNSLH